MATRRKSGAIRHYSYLGLYYLRSWLGDKRPLLGGIKLTHSCNLSCQHCPFHKRKDRSLSFPQAVSALETLHAWGVRILVIEGGEPFIWRDGVYDLSSVVAQAKRRFFSVGVTTNGTYPIEVDSDIVWVSIDGLQHTHDHIRGRSFDRVMSNIRASSHPKIYAHVTLNRLNWQEMPELVAYLSGADGSVRKVRGVTVQLHYPYEGRDDELLLPFAERQEALEGLIQLRQQGLPIVNSYASLRALKRNQWKCRPWMIASVDPDGTMTHGCYVQNRGQVSCQDCGFSAHTEISLAYNGVLESILVGNRVFFAG